MQPILLQHGEFKAIVYRVPRAHLPLFHLLADELFQSWQAIAKQVQTVAADLTELTPAAVEQFVLTSWAKSNWETMQAIAQLIPSAVVFPLNLDAVKEDVGLLAWLFLSQPPIKTEDGEWHYPPGRLVELQMVRHKEQVVEVDEETGRPLAQLPFPTCGNAETDTIFNLINAFGGNIAHAKLAYEWLDQQTLNDGIDILNELQRNPDERMREHLVRSFNKAMEEDPVLAERLNESMGLKPFSRIADQIPQPPTVEPVKTAPLSDQANSLATEFKAVTQRRTRKRSSVLQEPTNAD